MTETPVCSEPRKLTELKFVNLFTTEVRGRKGTHPWTFASRKERPGADPSRADAVVVIAVAQVNGERRLVLTREFRAPLGTFELAAPSGLIDAGETPMEAGARELKEETGLTLARVFHVSPPLASSAGLTDETVSLLYGEAVGSVSADQQEGHEDIETRLVTLEEILRLLAAPGRDIISSRLYPILLSFTQLRRLTLPGEMQT